MRINLREKETQLSSQYVLNPQRNSYHFGRIIIFLKRFHFSMRKHFDVGLDDSLAAGQTLYIYVFKFFGSVQRFSFAGQI